MHPFATQITNILWALKIAHMNSIYQMHRSSVSLLYVINIEFLDVGWLFPRQEVATAQ